MSDPPVVTGAAINAAAAALQQAAMTGSCASDEEAAAVMLEAAAPHLAYAAGGAAGDRIVQLEQLAGEILATYRKGSDGYRGRVGQVQIARWQAVLAASTDIRQRKDSTCPSS